MHNRRDFLIAAGLAAAGASLHSSVKAQNRMTASGLIRPKALRPGSTVGLITPSTNVTDPDRLATAMRTISYFGLKPRMAKNAGKRMGDYRVSIDERLDDLHSMFRDPEIDAVFAIGGSYGSEHILARIDYDLIHRTSKIFLCYSDITAMPIAMNRHSKLVTFHGPIVLSSFPE